jgi:hypothetical protein
MRGSFFYEVNDMPELSSHSLFRGPLWSDLRKAGSTSFAKLTILVPLIGYVILLHADLIRYVKLDVGKGDTPICIFAMCVHMMPITRYYFLYFGLFAIGAGSLLFYWLCPKVISTSIDKNDYVRTELELFTPAYMAEELNVLQAVSPGLPRFKDRISRVLATPTIELSRSDGKSGMLDWRTSVMDQIVDMASLRYDIENVRNWPARYLTGLFYAFGLVCLAIPSLYTFALVVRAALA